MEDDGGGVRRGEGWQRNAEHAEIHGAHRGGTCEGGIERQGDSQHAVGDEAGAGAVDGVGDGDVRTEIDGDGGSRR